MNKTETLYQDQKLRENRVTMIRMESFSGSDLINNALASFKESVLTVKNYLLYLHGFKGTDKSLSVIRSRVAGVKNGFDFNFVSNANMAVPCPNGFKGNFQSYTQLLNEQMTPILQEVLKEINSFSVHLSAILSEKTIRSSFRDDSARNKEIRKWRTKYAESVSEFFTNGSNQRLELDKMFANTGEIFASAKNALAAYECAYAADPRDITAAVELVVTKVNTLIEMGESSEDIDISRETLTNLSERAYEVGRLVELLGIRCTMCETAAVLSVDILDRVEKLKK